jgi:regulator of protease activity HflC (stomatin/prohibitin superfamily)
MLKLKMSASILAAAIMLAGCEVSTVPPAAKGKILSSSGYSADVKETGKYWLFGFKNMVILDTSTRMISENINVKMSDNLDLPFQLHFRTRIQGDDKTINAMFNDITHDDYQVSLDKVYQVYGRNVVTNAARSVMSKYKVAEVAVNFEKINNDIYAEINKRMVGSPLEVSDVTLANISYPPVITQAVEKQQERELAIVTEKNQQAIEMLKKENQLKLADADYAIRVKKAEAVREENRITSEGLSTTLLHYRNLEVMEKLAESQNKVFVPYQALGEVGVSNTMFK